MRKTISFVLLLVVVASLLPLASVSASPAAQFAGCIDEEEEPFAAKFTATSLNGFNMVVTVVGVEDFDPIVTVKQAGEVVACNDNSEEAAAVALDLPSVTTEASENTARVDVKVPGDQGRLDYEVYVGSADGTSGEFVLMYQGAEVFGSDNVDEFLFTTTEAQAEAGIPLGLYVANLKRPELAVDLELGFTFGNTTQTCQDSSSSSLCEGNSEDLTGSTVTLAADEDPVTLNGDDAYMFYELEGEAEEFGISVGSDGKASFGAYALMLHSAVAYPEAQ